MFRPCQRGASTLEPMDEDVVDGRAPTRLLSEEECWQRIREAPYGRIAVTAAGEIDVFP